MNETFWQDVIETGRNFCLIHSYLQHWMLLLLHLWVSCSSIIFTCFVLLLFIQRECYMMVLVIFLSVIVQKIKVSSLIFQFTCFLSQRHNTSYLVVYYIHRLWRLLDLLISTITSKIPYHETSLHTTKSFRKQFPHPSRHLGKKNLPPVFSKSKLPAHLSSRSWHCYLALVTPHCLYTLSTGSRLGVFIVRDDGFAFPLRACSPVSDNQVAFPQIFRNINSLRRAFFFRVWKTLSFYRVIILVFRVLNNVLVTFSKSIFRSVISPIIIYLSYFPSDV